MVFDKKIGFFIWLMFFALIAALQDPQPAGSAQVIVKPGSFNRLTVTAPTAVTAGQDAVFRITATDSLNNPIPDFSKSEKKFIVSVTGTGTVTPQVFSSADFALGVASVKFSSKVAETATITVFEKDNAVPLASKDFPVLAGPLHGYALRAPLSVPAGERFGIAVFAKDSFGNTIQGPIDIRNLNLSVSGDTELIIEPLREQVAHKGFLIADASATRSGTIVVALSDLASGKTGKSEPIGITSASPHEFKVYAPQQAGAGEPFEVILAALDRYGNVVKDYSTIGKNVSVSSFPAERPIFPSQIPAYDFMNGQTKVSIRIDMPGEYILLVNEAGKTAAGTATVNILKPEVGKYEIVTPDQVAAGRKFKIRITAFSKTGRVLSTYSQSGPAVILQTDGSGTLIPSRIPPSLFDNGVAVVEVQYDRSESISISAHSEEDSLASDEISVIVSEGKKAKKEKTVKSKKMKAVQQKTGSLQTKEKHQKKNSLKTDTSSVDVEGIDALEKGAETIVKIKLSSMGKRFRYTAFTEKQNGKKWIVVKITPATSGSRTFEANTSLIGDAVMSSDEKGGAILKLEQRKPARYRITKGSDALILTVKK